jgi:hypothetical protein
MRDDTVELRIASPRGIGVAVLGMAVVASGVFGVWFIADNVDGSDLGTYVVALPWLAVWLYLALAFAWMVSGCERVVVGSDRIVIRRAIGRLSAPGRRYPLTECANLRTISGPAWRENWDRSYQIGLTGGNVAFDYRGRSIRFGLDLTERDAQAVVEALESALDGQGRGS